MKRLRAGWLHLHHRGRLVHRRASPEATAFERVTGDDDGPENCAIAGRTGYDIVATFPLPASAWWDDYYVPLARRLDSLRAVASGDPGAEAQIEAAEREIAVFREHAGEYGYAFFILRKNR